MHKCLKQLLSAGIAVVFSMLSLAAPVAAEESSLSDLNGDGVIDVFDFVISKRTSVAESAPLNLSVSSAAGMPGEIVTVNTAISNNPGFSYFRIAMNYDERLEPAVPEGQSGLIRANKEDFPKLRLSIVTMEDYHLLICCAANSKTYIEDNGTLASYSFRIPDDAEPGTVYTLAVQDVEFSDSGTKFPLLTERGRITVLDPDAGEQPPLSAVPPLTTAEPGTETTAPQTTSAPATTTVHRTTTAAATTQLLTTATSASTATATTRPVNTTTTTATTRAALTTSAAAKTTANAETTTSAKTTKPFVVTTVQTTTTVITTTRPYLKHGIDISLWQGDVDFKKVKTDPKAQFVILRAGFGKYLKQEDPTFAPNYERAKAEGIPVGAYWYSYAKTPEEARIEANVCAQVLGDRKFEYPIAFDIEERDVLAMSIDKISAIIDAFCSELEKKGYFTQIYCSSAYLNQKINQDVKSRYDVWVANYNVVQPSFKGTYGMWQYGTGTVAGFSEPVDVDYCYRDYPAIMKRAKLNGY